MHAAPSIEVAKVGAVALGDLTRLVAKDPAAATAVGREGERRSGQAPTASMRVINGALQEVPGASTSAIQVEGGAAASKMSVDAWRALAAFLARQCPHGSAWRSQAISEDFSEAALSHLVAIFDNEELVDDAAVFAVLPLTLRSLSSIAIDCVEPTSPGGEAEDALLKTIGLMQTAVLRGTRVAMRATGTEADDSWAALIALIESMLTEHASSREETVSEAALAQHIALLDDFIGMLVQGGGGEVPPSVHASVVDVLSVVGMNAGVANDAAQGGGDGAESNPLMRRSRKRNSPAEEQRVAQHCLTHVLSLLRPPRRSTVGRTARSPARRFRRTRTL